MRSKWQPKEPAATVHKKNCQILKISVCAIRKMCGGTTTAATRFAWQGKPLVSRCIPSGLWGVSDVRYL